MTYEFRLYKNPTKAQRQIAKGKTLRRDYDYIVLLLVDADMLGTAVCYPFLTLESVNGKTSDEYDYKHKYGWGGQKIDWDFVITYRSSVGKEVDEHNDYAWFKEYIKFFANDFQWVESK